MGVLSSFPGRGCRIRPSKKLPGDFALRGWSGLQLTDILGLSPVMGFLNENDSFTYFAILGELSSGLSLTMGFSRLSIFSQFFCELFQGARRDIPRNTLMF